MTALRKILVVDDDPVVGTSFNRVLTNKGYQVITARDAHQALEELRKSEVDLVFTDIKMPGMNGLELAEKVKARRPWTPVVIVTGYGTQADEDRAFAAGVSAFLHKPLSPEQIEGSAAEALHSAPMPLEEPVAMVVQATEQPTESMAMAAPVSLGRRLADVALFFAAPFIGLVYALFLPFVGLGMLAWMGGKELAKSGAFAKAGRNLVFAGKLVMAPFVGLAFVVVGPVVALGALIWVAARAVFDRQPMN